MENQTSERKHADFSPSRLAILEKCPCWISDDKTSEAAQRGTDYGAAIARYATEHVKEDNPDLEYGYGIIDAIYAESGNVTFEAEPILDTGIPEVWGYGDLASTGEWETDAALVEIKSGFGDRPEASENVQVMSYALGLLKKGYEKVTAYLVELDKKEYTQAVFMTSDIQAIEDRINSIIDVAKKATFDNAQTGRQCGYCGKIETCPEVCLTPDTTTALLNTQNNKNLEPADFARSLTPETLSRTLKRVLPLFALADTYIGHLKSRAIALIEAGEEVPGYKVTEKRGRRKWIDEPAAMEALKALGVIDKITTLKTPAQAEKALGKAGKKMIEDYTEYGSPSRTLEAVE